MGLHINKQNDLDEMLNKFAKINPKNNQRTDFLKPAPKSSEIDEQKKKHHLFHHKNNQ
ncbi:SPJ_0845 family protein [Fructilactobacillus florum]|uniref:Uncharacterized protein n=1 Tax=Fructilactobacillus florum DSM 22689 = JCM 16035 TaxID=1423745 RepID=A0A0R2CTV5_9LACO|nr:SPJ_0845 family protein [Fructilactobacillus florum]KRM91691.1 hypothetical protein FC87_GL000828 [Fructilactobacillus florum DSM 22689 = JCM 16035]